MKYSITSQIKLDNVSISTNLQDACSWNILGYNPWLVGYWSTYGFPWWLLKWCPNLWQENFAWTPQSAEEFLLCSYRTYCSRLGYIQFDCSRNDYSTIGFSYMCHPSSAQHWNVSRWIHQAHFSEACHWVLTTRSKKIVWISTFWVGPYYLYSLLSPHRQRNTLILELVG